MEISIVKLEKILNYKIKKHCISLGWDTAEICGVSVIKTDDKNVYLDWFVLEFDKKDINHVYNALSKESLKLLSQKCDICIIEDTYLKFFWNPRTRKQQPQVEVMKKLTRFGGIILANAINNNVEYQIIGATSARSKFKIKTTGYGRGNAKQGVIDWIKNKLQIDLQEDNACDAIVLGCLGICEDIDFSSKKKKKRKKT